MKIVTPEIKIKHRKVKELLHCFYVLIIQIQS